MTSSGFQEVSVDWTKNKWDTPTDFAKRHLAPTHSCIRYFPSIKTFYVFHKGRGSYSSVTPHELRVGLVR